MKEQLPGLTGCLEEWGVNVSVRGPNGYLQAVDGRLWWVDNEVA